MESTVRKSKVYSYFHGANTVFQQFLCVVGALLIAMTFVAQESSYAKSRRLYEKYENLSDKAEELEDDYEKVYYDLPYSLDTEKYEMIEDTNSEYSEKIKAHNNALEEYNKAKEKAHEAYEKYENKRYGGADAGVLFAVLGVPVVLAGIVWGIYKKIVFKRKDGEQAYDEELQIRIEEAKVKAIEKVNIVSEQIEMVEPVVLNGIADYDGFSGATPVGKLSKLFSRIAKVFVEIEPLIIGLVVAAGFVAVSLLLSGALFIPVIALFGLAAFLGMKIYKKYEVNSYVNPKTIEKLEKFDPDLIVKIGSDDCVRVSLPAITVYMFSEDQLYMYYQYLDIVTGKVFCEGVYEYFYKDVVGVTSSQEVKKIFKRQGLFKLRTITYLKEYISVVTSGCTHKESYITPVGQSILDTNFVGMRNLIRQKKTEKE